MVPSSRSVGSGLVEEDIGMNCSDGRCSACYGAANCFIANLGAVRMNPTFAALARSLSFRV